MMRLHPESWCTVIIMMRLHHEISTLGTGTRTILNFWTVREFYLTFAFCILFTDSRYCHFKTNIVEHLLCAYVCVCVFVCVFVCFVFFVYIYPTEENRWCGKRECLGHMKEAVGGSTVFCDVVSHHVAILFETFAQELVSLRMDLQVHKL